MPRLSRLIAVAALAALAAACTSLANSVAPTEGYAVETLAYRPGPRGGLDLYTPVAARADAPVVVFFYGGSWRKGSKDMYPFVAEALTSLGAVVAVPDYRLSPAVTFPAFVEDGAAAVAELRRRLPDRRIVLMGHSAGAHIAALLALDPSYLAREGVPACSVSGLVGLSGPYDFLPLRLERYRRIFPEPLLGASQPINHAGPGDPPALLATGSIDTLVRPRNTEVLAAKLKAAGVPVTERHYNAVGHLGTVAALSGPLRGRAPVMADLSAFLSRVGDRCS